MQEKLNSSILKILAYFDLFQYPLSAEEIQKFLDQKAGAAQLSATLDWLVLQRLVFPHGDWYSLRSDSRIMEERRLKNDQAKPMLALARRISGFLFHFPFVRGIGISGSLSKNCADSNTDIDFFIITRKNRLWIGRTIMHFFKKLTFLTGHQHWYCMNYYIDESALCIEEKNIFTAVELATLLPVQGKPVLDQFFKSNNWIMSYFPNQPERTAITVQHPGLLSLKKMIEYLFNNMLGDWLDNYLMRLTTRRWKLKEDQFELNIKGNRMGLRTGKHYSKPNPVFFQERILSLHRIRFIELQEKLQAVLRLNKDQPFFLKEII